MNGPLILVIDDEPQIHRFLRPVLEAAGFAVTRADNGAMALREAASRPPALILLDLGLPDGDGLDFLPRLRGFCTAPVIVLSARDRTADKIRALDAGADDYVEKPFDLGELQARIRAALRHNKSEPVVARNVTLGALSIDFEHREVRVGGAVLALSPREYDLLTLLARHHGKVITHRQLLTTVWGPAHTDDVQYLRVYVRQLRLKLGNDVGKMLRTEPNIGYRLAASWPS
jgi:two-component system KDP operon response regulator KdpE